MSMKVQSTMLRLAMAANAVFSTVSGILCLAFTESMAVGMGLGVHMSGELYQLGVSLLVFAAFLIIAASSLSDARPHLLTRSAMIAIVLDVLWVLGSVMILSLGTVPLNSIGQWSVAIIALIVFDFAVFQTMGLRRVRLTQAL